MRAAGWSRVTVVPVSSVTVIGPAEAEAAGEASPPVLRRSRSL